MNRGRHTLDEIMSQPRVWPQALKVFDERQSTFMALMTAAAFDGAIVTGCGSTYYLALFAARLDGGDQH